jgi:hypothetical protein
MELESVLHTRLKPDPLDNVLPLIQSTTSMAFDANDSGVCGGTPSSQFAGLDLGDGADLNIGILNLLVKQPDQGTAASILVTTVSVGSICGLPPLLSTEQEIP